MKGPAAALGCCDEEKRMRLCQDGGNEHGWMGPGSGKKKTKAHAIPSAPAGETEDPDVKKDYLQKHPFLPIPE